MTEQAFEGDYTGPQGARRVLEDPYPDVAVLETARGGILLRGVAYESNDVGVVTNISADHLGLQGIDTLEGLAEVKSLIVRLTRPGGLVVLNADDPLVRAMASVVRAPVLYFSRQPESAPIREHLAAGGRALCWPMMARSSWPMVTSVGRSSRWPMCRSPSAGGRGIWSRMRWRRRARRSASGSIWRRSRRVAVVPQLAGTEFRASQRLRDPGTGLHLHRRLRP